MFFIMMHLLYEILDMETFSMSGMPDTLYIFLFIGTVKVCLTRDRGVSEEYLCPNRTGHNIRSVRASWKSTNLDMNQVGLRLPKTFERPSSCSRPPKGCV